MKLLFIAALLGIACSAADVSIKADLATGAVHVANVANGTSVKGLRRNSARLAAMSGAYSWKDGTLTFTPRYPLVAGVQYKAVYRDASITFELPTKVGASTRLEKMYPRRRYSLPTN